jgi:NTP pyrophosphatase (non-canonical NTP hydrolase)
MDLKEFQKACKKTAVKFDDSEKEILTWGCGIAGEAGDVASCIKKTYIHKKDVKDGMRENLGDTLWYMAMICNFMGWELEDIMKENYAKLTARFPEGFTLEAVQRDMVDWNKK